MRPEEPYPIEHFHQYWPRDRQPCFYWNVATFCRVGEAQAKVMVEDGHKKGLFKRTQGRSDALTLVLDS